MWEIDKTYSMGNREEYMSWEQVQFIEMISCKIREIEKNK